MAKTESRARSDANIRLFDLYSRIVGGSDFNRTLSGPADVCRLAYKRALVALKVFDAIQEQGGER